MSAAKHTLYEWRVADNDPQFVYALNPAGYNHFWFRVSGVHTSSDELEANARLIAAAPELLDCLQQIHDSAPECWWNLPIELQQAIKASLAKATGGAA